MLLHLRIGFEVGLEERQARLCKSTPRLCDTTSRLPQVEDGLREENNGLQTDVVKGTSRQTFGVGLLISAKKEYGKYTADPRVWFVRCSGP